MITLRAAVAVERFGANLVGQVVGTYPMGSYPGGRATLIEINPDLAAPEIVCCVRHPSWRDEFNPDGEIGVFADGLLDIVSLESNESCNDRWKARDNSAAVFSPA